MSGEELKKYIKSSGLTMSDVARELGTTPQNVQARLGRKTIKIDFIQKIKEIIDRCAPPLPAEMEAAVIGSNVNGSNSSNVSQSLALGHSFGVRVTDTYINADLSRVDEANRRVIDYVLYNKK